MSMTFERCVRCGHPIYETLSGGWLHAYPYEREEAEHKAEPDRLKELKP